LYAKKNDNPQILQINSGDTIQILDNVGEIKNTCAIFNENNYTYMAFSTIKQQVSLWVKQDNTFVKLGNLWTSSYPINRIYIGPEQKTLIVGNNSGVILAWPLKQLGKITKPDEILFKSLKPHSFFLPGGVIDDFVLIHNAAFIRKQGGPNPWQRTICFAVAHNFDFATLE